MTRLKAGDKISCRVRDGVIVSAREEYDEAQTFEIVAVEEYGYYLFVPRYVNIRSTIFIDVYRCRKSNIDPRFLGEEMIHIDDNMVWQVVQRMDGMTCFICDTFCGYAAANQEDGTFVCFSCRRNPYI